MRSQKKKENIERYYDRKQATSNKRSLPPPIYTHTTVKLGARESVAKVTLQRNAFAKQPPPTFLDG